MPKGKNEKSHCGASASCPVCDPKGFAISAANTAYRKTAITRNSSKNDWTPEPQYKSGEQYNRRGMLVVNGQVMKPRMGFS